LDFGVAAGWLWIVVLKPLLCRDFSNPSIPSFFQLVLNMFTFSNLCLYLVHITKITNKTTYIPDGFHVYSLTGKFIFIQLSAEILR
jgi:hypothetical protein